MARKDLVHEDNLPYPFPLPLPRKTKETRVSKMFR